GQDAHSSAVAPQHGRGRRRRVRGNAGHTVRGVCAAEFQPVHRYRLGVAGVRRHGQRSPVDPPGDRSVGPPPLVPGAVAGTPDRDRDVAPGQRGQGRAALRIHPDSRPDELHVLDAQRLTGIPVLPARIGRRVQPHHDVPGMVNRVGADVPGLPRRLRWVSPLVPLVAGPLPVAFFIGVLAGEEPIDHTQKNVLREGKSLHPIMERVMSIHVAEEARHISFAHEYLRKRLPRLTRMQRFWISLYFPLTMRSLCNAIVVPPKAFWEEFDIPREVKKELFFGSPESRKWLCDMFADARMLAHDTGLMNPIARLVWRLCKIDGKPSRYRSEPQRQHLAAAPAA
ncbi:LOW QUALITY PROTEIN: conserved hypothetical protein, partial [Mycobacterium tuberculosis CPHL_A]